MPYPLHHRATTRRAVRSVIRWDHCLVRCGRWRCGWNSWKWIGFTKNCRPISVSWTSRYRCALLPSHPFTYSSGSYNYNSIKICKQISTPHQPYQKTPDIYFLRSCTLPNFISIPSPITIQFVVDVFVLYVILYLLLYCLLCYLVLRPQSWINSTLLYSIACFSTQPGKNEYPVYKHRGRFCWPCVATSSFWLPYCRHTYSIIDVFSAGARFFLPYSMKVKRNSFVKGRKFAFTLCFL